MDGNTEKLNTSTEEYIDKQYENAREFELKKEIMEEVKSYIRDAVRTEFEVQKMTLEDSFKLDRSVQPDYSEFLQHLKKEIDFMRKQIENRDELINSFLTQKTVTTETSHKKQEKDFQENQNIFKKPKKLRKQLITHKMTMFLSLILIAMNHFLMRIMTTIMKIMTILLHPNKVIIFIHHQLTTLQIAKRNRRYHLQMTKTKKE